MCKSYVSLVCECEQKKIYLEGEIAKLEKQIFDAKIMVEEFRQYYFSKTILKRPDIRKKLADIETALEIKVDIENL